MAPLAGWAPRVSALARFEKGKAMSRPQPNDFDLQGADGTHGSISVSNKYTVKLKGTARRVRAAHA